MLEESGQVALEVLEDCVGGSVDSDQTVRRGGTLADEDVLAQRETVHTNGDIIVDILLLASNELVGGLVGEVDQNHP